MDGENDGNDQNSNPELPENGEVTTEERASSVSVHDSAGELWVIVFFLSDIFHFLLKLEENCLFHDHLW